MLWIRKNPPAYWLSMCYTKHVCYLFNVRGTKLETCHHLELCQELHHITVQKEVKQAFQP